GVPRFALRRHSHGGLAAAGGVAALPALVFALVLGSAAAAPGASLAAAPHSALGSYLRGEVNPPADAVEAASQSAPAAWTRLVTIERGLTAQQDELTAQE